MRLNVAFALLIGLLTSACGASGTPLLATSDLLEKLPRIENSPRAPCWQQVQIARQNSFLATVTSGNDVVYKAPCDIDPPPKKATPAPAKPVAEVDPHRARRVAAYEVGP